MYAGVSISGRECEHRWHVRFFSVPCNGIHRAGIIGEAWVGGVSLELGMGSEYVSEDKEGAGDGNIGAGREARDPFGFFEGELLFGLAVSQ